ncbi:xlf-protein [Fusarium sporotrichioides]|uniref:Non-homologous end-joining factor 1 n=1 Tax=Fusarium sporotrichioides TaxID=5514 RepID=A0A395SLM6_FUSSP|nr:xlf-protein [Fusarium sporotrichioides]
MSLNKSWRPLPLQPSPDLPVLLVSFHTDTSAYTIHITDMANMWTESLDRKAIFMRGWNENTSIDPSDTPDNMAKFLASISTALDSSQPGHYETSLCLDHDNRSEAGEDDLILKITCEISGLQPLKWPMYLKKLPAINIATNLVLPLIQTHHAKDLEIASLIQSLGHKDAVLTKLLDKLEAMGTGMEHIFNILSGKKKVSRVAAAEKVPGLAPFDRRRWKADLQYKQDSPDNPQSLVESVFENGGLEFEPMLNSTESPQLDQWWQNFEGVSSVAHQQRHKAAVTDSSSIPKDTEISPVEDGDDDFQVQSTPPHLASKRKSTDAKETLATDDVSTEGESAGSVSPVRNAQKADKPARRLGALGRKKQSTPPPSPGRSDSKNQQQDDSETASEAEEDDAAVSPPAKDPIPSSVSPARPLAKKSVLGRIGGAKSKHSAEKGSTLVEPEVIEISESSSSAVSHRPPRKLGVIGRQAANVEESTPSSSERGRSDAKESTPEPKVRETSQERADRRREELKKELEKKAAAGPAKKKRRF